MTITMAAAAALLRPVIDLSVKDVHWSGWVLRNRFDPEWMKLYNRELARARLARRLASRIGKREFVDKNDYRKITAVRK